MTSIPDSINDDFSQKVIVNLNQVKWQPSPMPGVERKMLDRIGTEVARATTVVRFLAGKAFSPHTHNGGEEFLVLNGVFSDETGDYGPLSYVRNPPGSSHTPFSEQGCEIFVKLCQMRAEGEPGIQVKADKLEWEAVPGKRGVWHKPLFKASQWYEDVALEKRDQNSLIEHETFEQGAEVLILSGSLSDGQECYPAFSWIRYPCQACASFEADEPVIYWIKRGINAP